MPKNDSVDARERIAALVEKYKTEVSSGGIKKYTEEDIKKGFILPLFEALGWDTTDRGEVSSEEIIRSSGRVDYGFYLNGWPKFYLEAKSVKANIHDEQWARQAIRYSWNRGVTWAVLTNFERLIVFNAQDIKSSLHDKKLFDISYADYLANFEKLDLLSKESFAKNALDAYAESVGKKYQRVPISALLYKDLDECRELLTRSLAAWNKEKFKKDPTLLDEGVQKLLDRLIFIRVAEDRGVEPPTLIPLVREWEASKNKNEMPLYASMVGKFRELDKVYNSNLFSEHPFESWDEYDGSTEKAIKILYGQKDYYEYDFKAMPADVLGTVYENYLGHRLSQSRKGVSLDKDAGKRKEQGIYYTPSFVVDYIVKHALQQVLDSCTTVDQLLKIKVLDPACGSGSFLIKALEVLNDKYKSFGYEGDENTKLLILTHNIYGVDLDEQAVEIARLNLLINSLDGKIKLPYLTDHIKCGNSLVSGTDAELKKYFGANWPAKRAFNWEEEFPSVFAQGGFDVVIGNPPYVNLANIKDADERDYLKAEFETAKNKSDLYSFFAEKAIKLLRPSGRLGFIFSNSWMGTDSFSKFREYLLNNTKIDELVKLPPDVFPDAMVTTILIFLAKEKVGDNHSIQLRKYEDGQFIEGGELSYKSIRATPGGNITFEERASIGVPTINLGDIAKISMGIKTSDNEKFILDEKKDENSYPLLRGKDMGRYWLKYDGKWIWYMPKMMMEKVGAGPRRPEYFLTPKLLFREITGGGIMACFDDGNYFTNNKVHVLYKIEKYNLFFILAIVNSTFIDSWVKSVFNNSFQVEVNQLEKIPVVDLDLSNKEAKDKYDAVSALAEKMTNLQKELAAAPENSNEWNRSKAEIEKTDNKINAIVRELYDAPEEDGAESI